MNDFGCNGNVSVIDVNEEKVVRIGPLRYERQYDRKQFNPWKMEAHGHF